MIRFIVLLTVLALVEQRDVGQLRNHRYKLVGSGIASLYRPWNTKSKFVPYGMYPGNKDVKPSQDDLVCAHRTLPFGTLLRLDRPGQNSAYCVVLDRGPYGFCQKVADEDYKERRCKAGHRFIVSTKRRTDGYYRGIIDATPAVHEMMGSTGWSKVTVRRAVHRKKTRHVLRLNASAKS